MIFSDIYNAVADQVGDTSADNITRIKRYINWAQQDICSRDNWDFLMKTSFIQCTAPYTTGTCYASGTTVTGVDTTWTSAMVGRKIRIGGESEYYTISAFVSTTELTISQSYMGDYDTLAEATTYSIYQDVYSLASDVEKVVSMTLPSSSSKLTRVSRQEIDALEPNPQSEGTPVYWTEVGRDSDGYRQIQLYNIPDDDYVIYYWYRKQLSDLSGDSDLSVIPSAYHKSLYLGACYQYYDYDQDNQGLVYRAEYENMIEDMRKYYMTESEDNFAVL